MSIARKESGDRLCWVEYGATELNRREDGVASASHIDKALYNLLPAGTAMHCMLEQGTSTQWKTFLYVLLQFTDIEAWKDWVLDGFEETENRSLDKADELWAESGSMMFCIPTPQWQTPVHFIRNNIASTQSAGQWYSGPPLVGEFLKEMHRRLEKATTKECYRVKFQPWCNWCHKKGDVGDPCLCQDLMLGIDHPLLRRGKGSNPGGRIGITSYAM